MENRISHRGVVRIVSFGIAIIAFLAIFAFKSHREATQSKLLLKNAYARAVGDLSISTDNISTTLSKGIYSGTPEMLSSLSSKLWLDSSNAKAHLSQLPVTELKLENTNKFLSQVGNYALSISKKTAEGDGLTDEEYKNLSELYEFSKQLKEDMWELDRKIQSGELSFEKVDTLVQQQDQESPPTVTEGFTSLEEGFNNYPTLIYDGPFSDHLLEKKPELTKGLSEVSVDDALKKAATASGIYAGDLKRVGDEDGNMPAYCFENENTSISVTKKGGLLNYMIKYRPVDSKNLSPTDAIGVAGSYLKKLGIDNMKSTYYETYNNITVVNFAAKNGDVTLYTDLIKVAVALDNGEIMGFDCRGYVVNHRERDLPQREISLEDAEKSLSPLLTINSSAVALIPTDGQNEKLTYEFNCTSKTGANVLVYVNVENGNEEQILLIYKSETGVLTV